MACLHRNTWTDQEVEQHWDSVADLYLSENDKVSATHDQRYVVSIERLGLMPGARVLNVSSRDCEAVKRIHAVCPSAEVMNAEISSGLMQVAYERNPSARQVKLGTYSELPFPDGEFSHILSLETLEHAADPICFLRELHRVSRPDARMVLSCPPKSCEWSYRLYSFLFGGHGEGPHRFPASSEVAEMLRKTEWDLQWHAGTLLLPIGPNWARRLAEGLITRTQGTWVAELGIRQFFACRRASR